MDHFVSKRSFGDFSKLMKFIQDETMATFSWNIEMFFMISVKDMYPYVPGFFLAEDNTFLCRVCLGKLEFINLVGNWRKAYVALWCNLKFWFTASYSLESSRGWELQIRLVMIF